jgi:hypothetical protein
MTKVLKNGSTLEGKYLGPLTQYLTKELVKDKFSYSYKAFWQTKYSDIMRTSNI